MATKRDCTKKWRDKAEAFAKLAELYAERDETESDEIPGGYDPDTAKREKFRAMAELAEEAASDFSKL